MPAWSSQVPASEKNPSIFEPTDPKKLPTALNPDVTPRCQTTQHVLAGVDQPGAGAGEEPEDLRADRPEEIGDGTEPRGEPR